MECMRVYLPSQASQTSQEPVVFPPTSGRSGCKTFEDVRAVHFKQCVLLYIYSITAYVGRL